MGIAPGYGRRRGESFGERVWKFRGVIAVASVPVRDPPPALIAHQI